ncbi:unnamed protein product [Cuscuta campestris]|uniref:GAG-pre-integrase domain-containing protein n=1 Tax=Cuscuta campestris TaxID=132261 RepID=A0A484M7N1_9ASTE|nr:unnamed protein product [Cuscuta campestris]
MDRSSKIVIGQGDLRNGVYVFASVPASALVANIDPFVLHQRLGHPSVDVLPFLGTNKTQSVQPSPSPVIPAVPATQQPTQQSPSPSQSPSESSTPSASSDDDDNPESSSVETTSPSPILPSLGGACAAAGRVDLLIQELRRF